MVGEEFDRFSGWKGLRSDATGFFRVEEMDGRWWFIDPDGYVFISMGANHIDPSALKYPDNVHIWREKYGTMKTWIQKGVVKDLKAWGFNTIGWTQEMLTRYHIHSYQWRHVHFQWAKMPYCYRIDFAEFQEWNQLAYYPDVFSKDFEERCDALARQCCVDMAEDPYLLGYFYQCAPLWGGIRYMSAWAPPKLSPSLSKAWADELDLTTKEGQAELKKIAEQYYQVCHDSIRRYDENHLILGDSYQGNMGIPDCVLEAAVPFVDVPSIQYLGVLDGPYFEKMTSFLKHVYELTSKPILMADTAPFSFSNLDQPYPQQRLLKGKELEEFGRKLYSIPYVIGWHYCSWIGNKARGCGLKYLNDEPDHEIVNALKTVHKNVYKIHCGGH